MGRTLFNEVQQWTTTGKVVGAVVLLVTVGLFVWSLVDRPAEDGDDAY